MCSCIIVSTTFDWAASNHDVLNLPTANATLLSRDSDYSLPARGYIPCRAQVALLFECNMSGAEGQSKVQWLLPHQILQLGGLRLLYDYARMLRSTGILPTRGSVTMLLAGPPCQQMSRANRLAMAIHILSSGQARLVVLLWWLEV